MKGQYFGFDAVVATIIFLLVLGTVISYWTSLRENMFFSNDELMKRAIHISEVFFQPGNPPDFQNDPQHIPILLGLSKNWTDKCFEEDKVSYLEEFIGRDESYSVLKEQFSSEFDFFVVIQEIPGDKRIEIGRLPDITKQVAKVFRFSPSCKGDKVYTLTVFVYS